MDRSSERFVIVSGCSGGGKSTLLAELSRRGYRTVLEPGRRVVEHELKTGGTALPWQNPEAFLRRAIAMALEDRAEPARHPGWVFFDRGLIDALVGLEHLTGSPEPGDIARSQRYHARVFLTPPWPEIYVTDPERRHGLADAVAEYDRLLAAYPALGYETIILPRISVEQRADFVLEVLGILS